MSRICSIGMDIQKAKEVLQNFLDCFNMPAKEFCEKYNFSKETEQYLESLEKRAVEKERLLSYFSQN